MKIKLAVCTIVFALALLLGLASSQAFTIRPNTFDDPDLVPTPDSNLCSLRYAVQTINSGAPVGNCMNETPAEGFGMNDTILLDAGRYVLTIPGNNEDDNETGDLDVETDIQIIGAGSDLTTVDASGIPDHDRIIDFDMVINPVMTGLTLTEGDVSELGQFGGAIQAFALFLTLQDVQVVNNKASTGGGIAVTCQPTIVDSLIQGNQAILGQGAGNAGGIYIANLDCGDFFIATINNSWILDNEAQGQFGFGFWGGGGIYLDFGTALIMQDSTVDNNMAFSGCGGGIANLGGTVVGISNSTISNNQANFNGGGICDDSDYLFLTNSTVSTNHTNSSGGGIGSSGGLKGVYNVTVAFNEAEEMGGGLLKNFDLPEHDDRFEMEVFNTIVAKNTAPTAPDCYGEFLTGGYNLIGILDDNCTDFNAGDNDQVGSAAAPIDPLLLGLNFYGGPTKTHALDLNSPAVDMANPAGCQTLDQELFITTHEQDTSDTGTINFVDLDVDQRYFTRPIAIRDPNTPICDVGAFELQAFNFQVTKDDGLGGTPIPPGTNFTYTIVLTNTGPGDANGVLLSDPLPPQVSFNSLTTSAGTCIQAGGAINCDLGDILNGAVVTVTINVTATATGDALNTVTVTTSDGDFTASVLTQIISQGIIEGSGFLPCSLQTGAVKAPPRLLWSLLFLSLVIAGTHLVLRRRARG